MIKERKLLLSTFPPPKIDEIKRYSDKRNEYYRRLENERTEFNKAHQTINDRQSSRLRYEREMRVVKDHRRFRISQVIRTLIFFILIVLCILIGLDVFNKTHCLIEKIESIEGFSFGMAIFLYVVFCIVSLVSAIIFTVKMFSNESYESYVKYGKKGYKTAAVIVSIISSVIVSLNLAQVVPNLGKNKLIYLGGNTQTYEYIDKGDSIKLPEECLKSDIAFIQYLSKYVLIGWEINGEIYAPGSTYTLKGKEEAKAIYREDKYCKITVSTVGYATVSRKR